MNALKHQCNTREKKLQQLQTEYEQMVKDAEEAMNTDAGESQEAQTLRVLENRLDKMNLKCSEAKRIRTTYERILEHLKEERRTWPNQLDALEQAIKVQREELKELNAMNNDAQLAREAAKAELSKLEQSVYEAKKEREAALSEYKKQAEEKKEHADKVEKRVRVQECIVIVIDKVELNYAHSDTRRYEFCIIDNPSPSLIHTEELDNLDLIFWKEGAKKTPSFEILDSFTVNILLFCSAGNVTQHIG